MTTTLTDIYKAAGMTIEGDQILMTGAIKPFDIVLRVSPTSIEMQDSGNSLRVQFNILLHNEIVIDQHRVYEIDYDETITLPVDQVRLFEKENK